ncbi:MAG TPA: alkaline phosphatase family protein [Candidatus Kapabacteria bacterium]|nr:alkaline phosphatase family protein [Candidatus Kapabacteria bacterium]
MFFKKKKKLAVLGIDGVPYELLKHLAETGTMPNVKRAIEKYGIKKTKAPLPEVSSVSWTSFMTGMNPGENGIFGFMEVDPGDYSYIFPSFRELPVQTVWEVIDGGKTRKKSIIINLPGTYPARSLNGLLVSGFVAPDLGKSVYPESLLPLLRIMNYQVDVDASLGRGNKKIFLKELNHILDCRYRFFNKMVEQKWDLFFFIITETDRLHHFLFDALADAGSEFHAGVLAYYGKIDRILGEIMHDMERKGIPFIILSDHGFVKIKQEVYLSQYLKEWGYLDFSTGGEEPKNIKNITGKSKIFVLDPSRLYIHQEKKYRRGCVKKEEYESLRDEIKARFLDLEIEGEKVIKEVFYKEDIYYGPYLEQAPDIVLLSYHGFDLKSGITKESLYGKTFFQGMHSQDNALLIDSYGFELPGHPYIYEIGEKLLTYF